MVLVYVSMLQTQFCSQILVESCFIRNFVVQISGEFKIDGNGNVELKEEDGIDYAAVTVQLPGGERVPFLFTIKELEAKGTADAFGGEFVVPSYRGSSFLDPKVISRSPFCKYIHDKQAEILGYSI